MGKTNGRIVKGKVWNYPEPEAHFAPLAGYAAFYVKKMDAWYEEDEEVIGHPHEPYHRVDVLQSSRHLKISVDGEVVAETNRPKMLFETGLPPRYYIPPEDFRTELLIPSKTETVYPYKGIASYRSMRTNGEVVEDLVWHYLEPLPEAQKVKDHLCFYDEKVELEVDG